MADPSNSIKKPTEPKEEELDASVDADINPDPPTQADNKTLDGANDPNSADDVDGVPEVAEPRILAKKDATLREFLNKMDDHAPIVRTPNPLYPFSQRGTKYLVILSTI
jgi:transcription initiation factor TFIID subunit 10